MGTKESKAGQIVEKIRDKLDTPGICTLSIQGHRENFESKADLGIARQMEEGFRN